MEITDLQHNHKFIKESFDKIQEAKDDAECLLSSIRESATITQTEILIIKDLLLFLDVIDNAILKLNAILEIAK